MCNSDYTQARSQYFSEEFNPDVIIEANGVEKIEWMYAFYHEEEDIPEYLKRHARRNKEVSNIDTEVKISRITDEHLAQDPEKDLRPLE